MRRIAAILVLVLWLTGCSLARQTDPQRTATEELLISTAADRVARDIRMDLAPGTKVFVDDKYFDAVDGKYTIGAIRDQVLRSGAYLANDRAAADVVLEVRSGAQSIDNEGWLFGIPSFDIPIPLSGPVKTPELALFKEDERIGVSKVAVTAYEQRDGALRFSSGPVYGFAHSKKWVVLLLASWTTDDLLPEGTDKSSLRPNEPAQTTKGGAN